MAQKQFAVIYRWSVDSKHENYFLKRWKRGTERLKALGLLGSCLTRTASGDFIAFARWPNEEAREQAFAALAPFEPWPGILSFEETKLWVEEDLLTS